MARVVKSCIDKNAMIHWSYVRNWRQPDTVPILEIKCRDLVVQDHSGFSTIGVDTSTPTVSDLLLVLCDM